ncbi:Hypothetical protein NGAL_HAMBI490_28220 [Neorhizobium galegae bv. officinalis]|uniref:DUF1403 family protein n=1 Tax=Neorhizobium galegae TaxID=399 RepID=UPI00062203A3|nr:Hypothetical protein NGAL_HAMBI490_28220 [Neorhizobium galegae bv. officinalis]
MSRGCDVNEADVAFAAGVVVKSIDDLIRADPAWLGCWRVRLALKSGAVAAKMLGRNEGEMQAVFGYTIADAPIRGTSHTLR